MWPRAQASVRFEAGSKGGDQAKAGTLKGTQGSKLLHSTLSDLLFLFAALPILGAHEK